MPHQTMTALHVLAAEVHKHQAWLNQQLGNRLPPLCAQEQFKKQLPDLGLTDEALGAAWDAYVTQAMHSNELDVKGNEELFLHFVLGLRKTWRSPWKLDAVAANLALDEGTKQAKLLIERANLAGR